MDEYKLKNGTVYMVLAIGEEAVDETRLPIIMSRVAGILRLGKYNDPFPYMDERLVAILRMPGPLGTLNGNVYVLTEKGLRLYYALLDLLYDVKGREVVRKLRDVRKADRKRRRTKALEEDAVINTQHE
ncbi:MAG: hypothetical protein L7G97_05625 [Acidilobus sp.]|nr:hypothetical protein [Acidilobus sp.]